MRKIMDYKIIEANSPDNLVTKVKKIMDSEEFEPLGACTIARTNENINKDPIQGEDLFSYYQTMVKYEV